MDKSASVRTIQELYQAFNRGDIAAVLNILDPDAELIFEGPKAVPWTGIRRGREGWTHFFQAIGENADEMAVQMEPFAVEGDRLVAVGRYQGRVKATGKRIDSPLVHLWTFRGGKPVQCRELTNSAAELAAFTAGA